MSNNNLLSYVFVFLFFGSAFCSDILFVSGGAFSYPFVYDYLDDLAHMRTYSYVNKAAYAGFEKYIQQASRNDIVPLIDRYIVTLLNANGWFIGRYVANEWYKPNIGSKESAVEQFYKPLRAGFSMDCCGIRLSLDTRTIVMYKRGDAWHWKALASQEVQCDNNRGKHGDTIVAEVEGEILCHRSNVLKIRTFDKKYLGTILDLERSYALLETCYLTVVYAGIPVEHLKNARDKWAEYGIYLTIEEDKSVPDTATQNSAVNAVAVAQPPSPLDGSQVANAVSNLPVVNHPVQKVILGGYLYAQWHYFSTLFRIPRMMGFLRGLLGFLSRR